MKNFTIRLRFSHTPEPFTNPMNVFYNDNINKTIGKCDVIKANNEIIGQLTLDIDVPDKLFVYYRRKVVDGLHDAIQLREDPLTGKEAFTIAELLR